MENLRTSIIVETDAVLPPGAPEEWDVPFLNLVASAVTSVSPPTLLHGLKEIEKKLGRDLDAPRWSPRIIDLDILAWDERIISENGLRIPHPELMNRPFLVRQMALLRSDWRYPIPGAPYGHLTLAEIVHSHIPFDGEEMRYFVPSPQLVGVVNITPDSFSDGGQCLDPERAIRRIHELASQGASVIDIGAQSTRPGATDLSSEEEWDRLRPVLDLLRQDLLPLKAKPKISLDSFCPEVVRKALHRYPIDWINDVKGGRDETLLKVVAETGRTIVVNHSLTVPPSKEVVLSFQVDPVSYLRDWAIRKIEELGTYGIERDKVIVDPGIGFGKTALQSLHLLRNIDRLKGVGCEILVGHSRKSFLKILADKTDRDVETVGVSHCLLRRSVDYLRVHNVEAHRRSFTASALLEENRLHA